MVTIDLERAGDGPAREALLDRAMGFDRYLKPSQFLRDGRLPADGLALVARDGRAIVGSVRLWHVDAGGRPALLLGPLAVAPERQGTRIGSRLMRRALGRAAAAGHGAVILVGDAPYYARFGFDAALAAGLVMPAPVDPARFLGLELRPGALLGAAGPVIADGVPAYAAPLPAEATAPALAA
jgi:predicted N-acetyltransferase YhbS